MTTINSKDESVAAAKYAWILKLLEECSFGIALNANDFFSYASADMVLLDVQDLVWVIPMYKRYNLCGLNACMAYIAKRMPIEPHISYQFKVAYVELEKLNPEVHSDY